MYAGRRAPISNIIKELWRSFPLKGYGAPKRGYFRNSNKPVGRTFTAAMCKQVTEGATPCWNYSKMQTAYLEMREIENPKFFQRMNTEYKHFYKI